MPIGAGLMVLGVLLRVWSMATLGERFRGFEVTHEARGLETRGAYAVVRHRSYLAPAMIDLGMPLVLSVPTMVAPFVLPATLLVRRIHAEDQLLAVAYPESHPAYAAQTYRLIPGLY